MTSLEVVALFKSKSPHELTLCQAASLREYLESNPQICRVLGGREAVDEYLGQLPDVSLRSQAAEAKPSDPPFLPSATQPESAVPPPPTVVSQGRLGTIVFVAVLSVLLSGVAVWTYMLVRDAGPVAAKNAAVNNNVAENNTDPTDSAPENSARTGKQNEVLPKKVTDKTGRSTNSTSTRTPKSSGSAAGHSQNQRSQTEPVRTDQTWRGWEITKSKGARVLRKTEWDIDDPTNPTYRFLLVTGGASVTLGSDRTIDNPDEWLKLEVLRTKENAATGEIEILVDGESVGGFQVSESGLSPAPLVGLGSHRGKKTRIEIIYKPARQENEIQWQSLTVITVPKHRVELISGKPGGVQLARYITSPYPLLEDQARFLAAKPNGRTALVSSDRYAGTHALRVPTPDDDSTPDDEPPHDDGGQLAGFDLVIRKKPNEGEFRYVRFAFRKKGGGMLLLELGRGDHPDQPFRYAAGRNADSVSPPVQSFQFDLPDEWIVLTRDLYEDFGSFDLHSITARSQDGDAVLLDHVYLARDRDDFNRVSALPAEAVENSPIVKIAIDYPKAFKAMAAMAVIEIDGHWGSGMVVTNDGKIATTGYVASAPGKEARITLRDDRTFRGRTLGIDRSGNTAAVKIEAPGEFHHVPLDGDWPSGAMFAVAPECDWRESQRVAMVSAHLRGAIGGLAWSNVDIGLQHSGGPLITTDGRLVALHSHACQLGGGLHIPAVTIRKNWDRLVKGEVLGQWPRIMAPRLGLDGRTVGDQYVIHEIVPGSPAAKSGIQIGDAIEKVNGAKAVTLDDIQKIFARHNPGDKVTLELRRSGKSLTMQMALVRR